MRNFDTRLENLGATAAGRLSADEDNVRFNEMETFVSSTGITLDPQAGPDTDLTMMAQAASRAASGGVWGTGGGSTNAYTATASAGFIVPKAYFTGMRVSFIPTADNNSSCTLNAYGLGVKQLLMPNGSAINKGRVIRSGRMCEAIYDATLASGAGAFRLAPWVIQDTRIAAFASADIVVPHGATTVLNFGGVTCIGTDIATSGNGFTVGAIDRGAYLVLLRVAREITSYATKLVPAIRVNGSNYESDRQEDASAIALVSRVTWGVPIAPSDVVDFTILQENGTSASYTLKCAFIAYRLADQ